MLQRAMSEVYLGMGHYFCQPVINILVVIRHPSFCPFIITKSEVYIDTVRNGSHLLIYNIIDQIFLFQLISLVAICIPIIKMNIPILYPPIDIWMSSMGVSSFDYICITPAIQGKRLLI